MSGYQPWKELSAEQQTEIKKQWPLTDWEIRLWRKGDWITGWTWTLPKRVAPAHGENER
jgi:hypothetical protein